MDNSQLVLGVLEVLLGKGTKTKTGYAFQCPVCNHRKPKLNVNIETGNYNCWTCSPPTKGKTLLPLLKLVKASEDQFKEIKEYYKITSEVSVKPKEEVELPKEFKPLLKSDMSLEARHARVYVSKRGISYQDILKYNIGYCDSGRYKKRVIIPSYDSDGRLNYFIARSVDSDSTFKIDAPSCNKSEIIGFESFINWEVPVILCEGAFDAIAIKRNAIPLFGKTIPKALMMKLSESNVKTVYLALDEDAIKSSLEHSEKLLNLGKEVYLINLDGKDPSEIGFESMIRHLQSAKPLTFVDIFKKKMELS